jgi:integrase
MKITDTTVKEAEVPEKGRAHIWDDELTGFGLRVYPSGAKSFVFRYTSPKTRRRRLMALGECPPTTVHKARTRAERARGKVLDGKDPQADKDEARLRQSVTFREFTKIYIRRMTPRWAKRTPANTRRQADRTVLPKLGARRLDEVTRADISTLLDNVAEKRGPIESNRTHELIRAMLNKAEVWGFVPEGHANPARGIERFRENPRDRWLKPAEVERLMTAVRTLGQGEDEKDPGPWFRAFVPLLLLTGMRKGELLSLQWSFIDLERAEVRLPETKSGRPQVRQLSPPAVEILRFLPREKDNPHVFPSPRKAGHHRTDFRSEWAAVREKADLTDVTMHDMRRTAGSYMAQAGVPLQVIGDILGHTHPSITKVYARLADENRREALDALGTKLSGLMGLGQGAGS